MSFVVSARKYRPQKFEDVVGQEHVTRTLKNAIELGRVAHAYLFTGPRGVGKTTTARILAKSISCEHPVAFEPCNECEMCVSISNGQLIDVIEIDAASNRGIDDVRALIESVRYMPAKGKYKIYIIDEVHMLTRESFNALLKTLEEPPEYTVFIFATTDVHKMPLTILSRCQRYDFRRIQLDTIRLQLRMIADTESIAIEDKTLMLIARKADGALRDAESYFDQVVAFSGKKVIYETVTQLLNIVDDELLFRVTNAVLTKEYKEAFIISDILYSNGWNYNDFLERLIEHLRNIMVYGTSGSFDFVETAEEFKPMIAQLSKEFSQSDLLRMVTFVSKTLNELKFSPNQKLKVEIALSQLIGFEKTITISQMMSNAPAAAYTQPAQPRQAVALPSAAKEKPVTNIVVEKPEVISQPVREEEVISTVKSSDAPTKAKSKESASGAKKDSVNVSFDVIKEYWGKYQNELVAAKNMTLSGIIELIQPVLYERNTLTIGVSDPGLIPLFSDLEKLFISTSEKVWGKKLSFKFIKSTATSHNISGKPEAGVPSPGNAPGRVTSDDPYIDFLKNELGAEKLN